MKNMKRKLGTFALTMTGIGSILGSGWLFGAWKAAKISGEYYLFLALRNDCNIIYCLTI